MVPLADRCQGRAIAVNEPEQHRLFLAFSIPEQVRSAIAACQAELRSNLPENCATWTRPEQIHLTLKFFGNVPVDQTELINDRIATACQEFSPLNLRAQDVGAFPDLRFPRIIWVGISDLAGKLPRLQSQIELAVRAFTTEKPEGRVFQGHATLARLKRLDRRQGNMISALISKIGRASFGEWIGRELVLMRSQLSPQGAKHTALAKFPLLGS